MRIFMKRIQIISLFPEILKGSLNTSMLWKAQDKELVSFSLIDLRQFGLGRRKNVDDTPYGGVEYARQKDPGALVILPTPRGKMYKQSDANLLAGSDKGLIVICPRYEGYDERIVSLVDYQYCIGPYVLTGGEIPAMVIVDSVVRLIPGVLGGENSSLLESFQGDDSTIEFPQYTRPEEFRGLKVPEVLLNGNHAEIAKWRKEAK
jgi:tRNA (guanine37-N1)-methyltransferase